MLILCPHCKKLFAKIKPKARGTKRQRFMQFVYEAPNGCWLWMGGHGVRGYPHFNYDGKTLYAHRVSLELKLGRPIKPGLDVLHSCPDGDNPMCVNPDHLREGTHAENMRDMLHRGRRRVYGEKVRTAKLTEKQVLEIRANYPRSTQREIGLVYGLTQAAVSSIVTAKSWKHLL